MNLSVAELINVLIAAALRRKRLIIFPIIVFSALAVLAAVVWPRTYATAALLMLQERQSSSPLSLDGNPTRQGRLTADEIDTLLKSERVLTSAIIDMNPSDKPIAAEEIEGEIRSLRKRIGVSVVGSEFIEIELKDSERVGIGQKLSIILTSFFERLLTRSDALQTAREFALVQRQRDVAATKALIEDWNKRAKAAGAQGNTLDPKLAAVRKEIAELEQKVKETATVLLPGGFTMAMIEHAINDELRMASSRLNASDPLSEATNHVAALNGLAAEAARYRAAQGQVTDLLNSEAQALATSLRSALTPSDTRSIALITEWASIEGRYAEAVRQYRGHVERAKKGSGPPLAPFGLIAPDSIRIVDVPRDPELPTTSLLKIIVACLGAGVGLGIGLAALAEQLDDRIYEPRKLPALTGVEAVFRLPKLDAELHPDADLNERLPRKSRLSIVS